MRIVYAHRSSASMEGREVRGRAQCRVLGSECRVPSVAGSCALVDPIRRSVAKIGVEAGGRSPRRSSPAGPRPPPRGRRQASMDPSPGGGRGGWAPQYERLGAVLSRPSAEVAARRRSHGRASHELFGRAEKGTGGWPVPGGRGRGPLGALCAFARNRPLPLTRPVTAPTSQRQQGLRRIA